MTCDRICGNSDIFRNIDSHKFCLKSLDKHIMTRLKNSKWFQRLKRTAVEMPYSKFKMSSGWNVQNVEHWCIVSNQVFDVYNIAIVFRPFPTNGVGLKGWQPCTVLINAYRSILLLFSQFESLRRMPLNFPSIQQSLPKPVKLHAICAYSNNNPVDRLCSWF